MLSFTPEAVADVVNIYNVSGGCVATTRRSNTADIAALAPGYYVVEAVTLSGIRASARFCKK